MYLTYIGPERTVAVLHIPEFHIRVFSWGEGFHFTGRDVEACKGHMCALVHSL